MQFARGFNDIGRPFGVKSKVVREWLAEGAPILVLNGRTPVAELEGLWVWLLEHKKSLSPLPRAKKAEKGTQQRIKMADYGVLSAAKAKEIMGDGGEKALLAAILAPIGRKCPQKA